MSRADHPRRRLSRNTRGSAAFEAIWVALFLSTVTIIGLFLFQIVKTGGSGPIDNRTAGRSAALNQICAPVGSVPGRMEITGTRDDSSITIRCTPDLEGEERIAEDRRFWPALIRIGNARFANFNRAQEGEGRITVVRSEQETRFNRDFRLGGGLLAATGLAFSNEALTPMPETWRFDNDAWAQGNDRVVWERLSPRHHELFPRVYPSAL